MPWIPQCVTSLPTTTAWNIDLEAERRPRSINVWVVANVFLARSCWMNIWRPFIVPTGRLQGPNASRRRHKPAAKAAPVARTQINRMRVAFAAAGFGLCNIWTSTVEFIPALSPSAPTAEDSLWPFRSSGAIVGPTLRRRFTPVACAVRNLSGWIRWSDTREFIRMRIIPTSSVNWAAMFVQSRLKVGSNLTVIIYWFTALRAIQPCLMSINRLMSPGQSERRKLPNVSIGCTVVCYAVSYCKMWGRSLCLSLGLSVSVSELISELRWQSLEDRRKNTRLSLFYNDLHGLAAIPLNELQRSTRCTRYCGIDTFTVMSSRAVD